MCSWTLYGEVESLLMVLRFVWDKHSEYGGEFCPLSRIANIQKRHQAMQQSVHGTSLQRVQVSAEHTFTFTRFYNISMMYDYTNIWFCNTHIRIGMCYQFEASVTTDACMQMCRFHGRQCQMRRADAAATSTPLLGVYKFLPSYCFCLYGDHLLCIALHVLVSIVLLRASTRQVLKFRAPRLRDREDTNMSHAFFNGCCNRMHMMKSKSHSLDMLVGADNQNDSHIVQYILQTEHHCIRVYVYIYAYKIPDSCNTLQ